MKQERKEAIRRFVRDANNYLIVKYKVDLKDLWMEFKRYEGVRYQDMTEAEVFSKGIKYFYKKGLSKSMILYFKGVARDFYNLEIDFIDIVAYLSGYKSLPRTERYYFYRREVSLPFRERSKYNKNSCKNIKKKEEQKEKEYYNKYKFKYRNKSYSRYSYWNDRGYDKRTRRKMKMSLKKIDHY